VSQDSEDGFASLVHLEGCSSLEVALKEPMPPTNTLFTLHSHIACFGLCMYSDVKQQYLPPASVHLLRHLLAHSLICLAHCQAGDSGQAAATTRSTAAHKIRFDQATELQCLLSAVLCHVCRVNIWSKQACHPTTSVQDRYTSYKLFATSTYNLMFLLKAC